MTKKSDIIKKKKDIEKLEELIIRLSELDQESKRVKQYTEIIKALKIEYELELMQIDDHIPLKIRLKHDFAELKIIVLNVFLIVFEILNIFTDILGKSENKYVSSIAILIPTIVIYLNAKRGKDE